MRINEDLSDHYSYEHYLSSSEIKAGVVGSTPAQA